MLRGAAKRIAQTVGRCRLDAACLAVAGYASVNSSMTSPQPSTSRQ